MKARGRGQVVKLKKRSGEDEWLEKLHLDIATDCSQRLDELKLAFPFASRRAIASYVLQLALRQGVFPKGLTLSLPASARRKTGGR